MIVRKNSNGDEIYIFDNVFDAIEIAQFETYASSSLFKRIQVHLGSEYSRSNGESFFGSILSENDIENCGLFKTKGYKDLSPYFKNMVINRSWILCAESSTKYLYHTDQNKGCMTLLLYVNTFWHPEWGGETLFCNSQGEPEIAVACKPNRAVIFPSHILHKPSGISRDSIIRYTWTTTFK